MTLKERLAEDVKVAMKSGDRVRASCLRMLRSKILEQEVALRQKKGRDYQLDDDEALQVLATYAKQRRESIDSYRAGGREDLAEREQDELRIVEAYLPAQLDDAALREHVREAIAETGATSMKDVGAVMKAAMARVRGQADGKRVNAMVRELLAG